MRCFATSSEDFRKTRNISRRTPASRAKDAAAARGAKDPRGNPGATAGDRGPPPIGRAKARKANPKATRIIATPPHKNRFCTRSDPRFTCNGFSPGKIGLRFISFFTECAPKSLSEPLRRAGPDYHKTQRDRTYARNLPVTAPPADRHTREASAAPPPPPATPGGVRTGT